MRTYVIAVYKNVYLFYKTTSIYNETKCRLLCTVRFAAISFSLFAGQSNGNYVN